MGYYAELIKEKQNGKTLKRNGKSFQNDFQRDLLKAKQLNQKFQQLLKEVKRLVDDIDDEWGGIDLSHAGDIEPGLIRDFETWNRGLESAKNILRNVGE